jgi:hypothetical protein
VTDDQDPKREVALLRRAAAVIRGDTAAGVLDGLESGPFIRMSTARLLEAIAEAVENDEELPQAIQQTAVGIARHAVNRLSGGVSSPSSDI